MWSIAGVVVTAGWLSGLAIWQPESPSGEFEAFFDFFTPTLTLVIGVPLAIGSAALLRTAQPVLGSLAVVGTSVILGALASFAFFGGFCLDPGDLCVTTWVSRVAELLVALACLGAGCIWYVRYVPPA